MNAGELEQLLTLVCSGQKENFELAEAICMGFGKKLAQVLEEEGYHKLGLRTFGDFQRKELNLYGKNLEKIPDILPPFLTILYLVHNKLDRLPKYLPATLENISCNFNKISELPDELPANLLYFNCYDNQIKKLPSKLPDSLIRLDFSNNLITEPPTQCPASLKVIKFCGNPLKELGFITDLFYLKEDKDKKNEWWRKGWTYKKYQWVRIQE